MSFLVNNLRVNNVCNVENTYKTYNKVTIAPYSQHYDDVFKMYAKHKIFLLFLSPFILILISSYQRHSISIHNNYSY